MTMFVTATLTPTATRGVGAIDALRSILPEAVLPAVAALTHLGSVPLLVFLSALVYWFENRRGGAFAIATVLGAYGLTVAAKALFALPRPPETRWAIYADGFGFPSGHAVAAVVGWGALAVVFPRWSARRRYAAAAALALAVALSRVVLGVHYGVDVVAGLVVGAAYLGVLLSLDDVDLAFGLGTAMAAVAALGTGGGQDSLLLLGVTLGGWAGWSRFGESVPWTRADVLPAAGGAAAVGGLVLVGYAGTFAPPIEVLVGLVAGLVLVGMPGLTDWVRTR